MKTILIAVILSFMTSSLIAQTQEYYKDGNTIRCNGTEYLVEKRDDTSVKLTIK